MARPYKQRFHQYLIAASSSYADSVAGVEDILRGHDFGVFRQSATLVNDLWRDPRIGAVMDTRLSAIMGAPSSFKPASKKTRARKVAELYGGADGTLGKWQSVMTPAVAKEIMLWGLTLGVGIGQIIWDRSEPGVWKPRVEAWTPHDLRWDFVRDTFVMQTKEGEVVLPRPDESPHGDGQWVVWCPYGVRYGWRFALVRSLALLYIARRWNFRDWARYSERHGKAIIVGEVPSGADKTEKDEFYEDMQGINDEAVVIAPKNADGQGFGVSLVEATARTWETFQALKAAVDGDIAILVLGQNLTTEVSGGSLAAAKVQNLVRIDRALMDSSIGPALSEQVVWHDVLFNIGEPEKLAPRWEINVGPEEDKAAEAAKILAIGTAVNALKAASNRVDIVALLERFGVPLLDESDVEEEDPTADAETDANGDQVVVNPAAEPTDGDAPKIEIELTPSTLGSIITVNEARRVKGLGELITPAGVRDPDGDLTISQFEASRAAIISTVENAKDGVADTAPPEAKPVLDDKLSVTLAQAKAIMRSRAALAPHSCNDHKPRKRGARRASLSASTDADYAVDLEDEAIERGADALAPTHEAILSILDTATSYEDAKKKIAEKYKGLNATALQRVIARTRILASLAGRYAATKGVAR